LTAEHYAHCTLRKALEQYAKISDQTWQNFYAICRFRVIKKQQLLYQIGVQPNSFAFIYQGLMRAYVVDEKGSEYNKMFFDEGKFPGSMTALLTANRSVLSFEALEESMIIEIDFSAFRKMLFDNPELMRFQIAYLEKNWLLAKDLREVEIVQEDATARYLRFIKEHQQLASRLAQYHIASHLGITPTQLSRIRKSL
jgi:CRP-like cAMP-binding protein